MFFSLLVIFETECHNVTVTVRLSLPSMLDSWLTTKLSKSARLRLFPHRHLVLWPNLNFASLSIYSSPRSRILSVMCSLMLLGYLNDDASSSFKEVQAPVLDFMFAMTLPARFHATAWMTNHELMVLVWGLGWPGPSTFRTFVALAGVLLVL